MRSEIKFCAAVLALLAVAAPVAIGQAPKPTPAPATPAPPAVAAPAADTRMLPAAAAGYAQYQGEVSAIMAKPMANAGDLDKAMSTFGSPNPNQLSSAWISYSAIVAAQQPEFVTAVRDIDSYYGRDRVLLGMRNDVGYARTLKGGEQALQAALAVNQKDTSRISAAGSFLQDQARTLQSVSWGKQKVKDPKASAIKLQTDALVEKPIADAAMRLFSGPDLSAMLASVTNQPAESGSIWDKISVFTASAPTAAFSNISPVVAAQPTLKIDPRHLATANRMVTLAAFHAIEADKSNTEDVKSAMTDVSTSGCIDWAQMQLRSCISAAYTRAEASFCLARHGLELANDETPSVGSCFSEIAK